MIKRWGGYITLLSFRSFKVKLLYFKPGGEISHQRHRAREEVWLFIKGMGTFTKHANKRKKDKFVIQSGDVQKVGRNIWHHYKALKRTLVMEVQTGICKEEDIERA